MTTSEDLFQIRSAHIEDVHHIYSLLEFYAIEQVVLSRTHEDIIQNLDNFAVAVSPVREIVGCVALRDFGSSLFEVRSLVVKHDCIGKGIGKALVLFLIGQLNQRNISFRLFALTYKTDFFLKLGFTHVSMTMFPEKIWSDCVKCPKKEHCDEDAVLFEHKIPATH